MSVMFWFLMFIGLGMLQFMYVYEYQARKVISDEQVYKEYGYFHFLISRSLILLMKK